MKLKFWAINRQPILCIRKMSLRRKNNKLEFKKTEQILKTKGQDLQEVSVSHTCAEIDRQVPELLGVSRAVLENVIFCHQEDSLWPFRDNQTLKSIFDELFETTKFTKLNETLHRLYKDNRKKLKEEKESLDHAKFGYECLVKDMRQLQGVIENIRVNMSEMKTEKKRKDLLQASLRAENFEERLRLVANSRSLNEYKLEEVRKRVNQLTDRLTDVDHPTDEFGMESRRARLAEAEAGVLGLEGETVNAREKLEELEKERRELKESTVDFDVGEEKREAARLGGEVLELLGLGAQRDRLETRQLLEIAGLEANNRDIEIIEKEKDIAEVRAKNMGYVINERAKVGVMENDRERLRAYLKEAYNGNRVDEMKSLEEQRKKVSGELEKLCAEFQVVKAQRGEVSAAINGLIQQLKDESEMKKKVELAQEFVSFVTSKRDLARQQEVYYELAHKLKAEDPDKITFLGLEERSKKMEMVFIKLNTDLREAERLKIEIEAVLANNDTVRAESREENAGIVETVRAALGNKYPPEMNIMERFWEVKNHIRSLETDLISAAYAKNEFLMTLVDGSHEAEQCLLCEGGFSEEVYGKRKAHFEEIVGGVTPEEAERMKELEDFKKEYAILKGFRPEIEKMRANVQRVERMDADLGRLHASLGQTDHRVQQVKEEIAKLSQEQGYIKDMQEVISRIGKLEESIAGVDSEKFKGQDEDHLVRLHQRGQQAIADIPNLLNDKKTSLEIKEHNLGVLDGKIAELNKQSREINGKIQSIKNERKSEKSVEDLERDLETMDEQIAKRTKELCTEEAEMAEETERQEKELQGERAVYTKLLYLLPELERRHERLVRLNTAEKDENVIMANYKKLKEVERAMDGLRESLERDSKRLDLLREEVGVLRDKIELETGLVSVKELETSIALENAEAVVLEAKAKEEKATSLMLSEASSKVSRLEGIEEAHKKSAEDLYSRIYQNREKEMQYFERLTHFEYYRLLVEDLEQYMQSLESALVKYHKEKVEMINKNIAELWKLTYQNGDIKKIEIKAEQIVGQDMAGQKGNFDYRVMFYNRE